VRTAVESYLDCGRFLGGLSRLRCASCRSEHLSAFSCQTRGWMRQALGMSSGLPGMVSSIQTFGSQANWHPHIHALVSAGLVERGGAFHALDTFDGAAQEARFRRLVLHRLRSGFGESSSAKGGPRRSLQPRWGGSGGPGRAARVLRQGRYDAPFIPLGLKAIGSGHPA
jgi:hypothetical protein